MALNPGKPEITNYKHQLFKFQITSTKLFTLLNNSINGVTVLVIKIPLST
jgi:hypothetical protein